MEHWSQIYQLFKKKFLNFCAFKFTQFKNLQKLPPSAPFPKKNYPNSRSTHKWNLEIKFLGFKFDISKTIFLVSILIFIQITLFSKIFFQKSEFQFRFQLQT